MLYFSFSEGRPNRADLSVLVEHNDDPSGRWRFLDSLSGVWCPDITNNKDIAPPVIMF